MLIKTKKVEFFLHYSLDDFYVAQFGTNSGLFIYEMNLKSFLIMLKKRFVGTHDGPYGTHSVFKTWWL